MEGACRSRRNAIRDAPSLTEEADVQAIDATLLIRSATEQTCTQTTQIGGGSARNSLG